LKIKDDNIGLWKLKIQAATEEDKVYLSIFGLILHDKM